MPEVSIIIPTYNGEKYIVDTIKSVLLQDYDDYEIILIIDGSTDSTLDLIQNLSAKLVIIEQENQGIAKSRNEGIKKAKGNYIAFLDHDDIWHPAKLSTQLSCFKKNPDVGVVFGDFLRWNGHDAKAVLNFALNPDLKDEKFSGWIYHELVITNWVLLSSALFKADVVKDIGYFSPEFPPSDDWDFNIRASLKFRFYKIKQTVVLYRIYENQTSRKVNPINSEYEFRKIIIEKYGKTAIDGQKVNEKELNHILFKNYFDFGLSHLYGGDLNIAVYSFFSALKYRPFFLKSYIFIFISLLKNIFSGNKVHFHNDSKK